MSNQVGDSNAAGDRTEMGVGISVSQSSAASFVIHSLDAGGAAELSGMIKVGDEILAVDRKKLATLSVEEVTELLAGEEGSLVQVRVRRGGEYTYDVCLERSSCRPPPPTRKAFRAAEELPEQPRGAVERIYAGMAKLNQSIESAPNQGKFTEEELKVFNAAKSEEARQMQARAQREFDTQRRRNAEIQVLKREMKDMERAGAPFVQMLEYQNWIKRLQYEDNYGDAEELRALEKEAEVQVRRETRHTKPPSSTLCTGRVASEAVFDMAVD